MPYKKPIKVICFETEPGLEPAIKTREHFPAAQSKPRVLIAVDRSGWCFDRTAHQIQKHLSEQYDIEIQTVSQILSSGPYKTDVLIARKERFEELRAKGSAASTVLAIFEDPTDLALPRADAICVANKAFHSALRASLPPTWRGTSPPMFNDQYVYVTEAGVDLEHFKSTPLPKDFVVGWCGNSAFGEDDHKGLELVKGACRLASVPLVISDVAGGSGRSYEEMPAFYQGISVLVCMSKSEGAPNPVLEAMASGRPVISTRVGLAEDLLEDSGAGLIVLRSTMALAEALWQMQGLDLAAMGQEARERVAPYTWGEQVEIWQEVIEVALDEVEEALDALNPSAETVSEKMQRQQRETLRPVPNEDQSKALEHALADLAARDAAYRAGLERGHMEGNLVRSDSASTQIHLIPSGRFSLNGAPVTVKPKVLLTCDVPGWAFDVNLRDMAEYLKDDFDFEHWYVDPIGDGAKQ